MVRMIVDIGRKKAEFVIKIYNTKTGKSRSISLHCSNTNITKDKLYGLILSTLEKNLK